ncbi:MAG: bifunctional DNA-formamidopyrimidine glycosylase/DNA-(apurinic or apyrimidinic site) lyase [Victivallales bacterium]|nr:bifunctional DNA-formamidopyrimidine glycosylase/DNA-(apurinic or apyrimidinic site) lyase [Victivallales bacterium]
MPELPEVETVKRALEARLPGHEFVRIETFVPALRYRLEPLHDAALLHDTIISVRRRARYLIIELAGCRALVLHLGMTGTVRIVPAETPRLKHEHVVFYLENGDTFRFDDPRRFGFIQPCRLEAPGAEPALLAGLGPEPLSTAFTPEYLAKAFAGRRTRVKTALMDNAIVVGIGNIYANESLFLSGINPLTPAGRITLEQCRLLVDNVRDTLQRAITAGGTTISDFKGVDGSEGKFVQQLHIYGKDGEPCPHCGTPIRRVVIGGRGSFYCSKCQKADRE